METVAVSAETRTGAPPPPATHGHSATGALRSLWRRWSYVRQVDADDDESEAEYLQMVVARKRPLLKLGLTALTILLTIIALSLEDISRGKQTVESDDSVYDYNPKSIDLICRYDAFQLKYNYGNGYANSKRYYYGKKSCEHMETADDMNHFCGEMERLGQRWLGCGIAAILALTMAMAVILKPFDSSAIVHSICSCIAAILLICSVMSWSLNERCSDVEALSTESTNIEITAGAAMILMYLALASAIISLIRSIFETTGKLRQAPGTEVR